MKGGARSAEERTSVKCAGEEDLITFLPIDPQNAIRLLQNGKYWCFDVYSLWRWLQTKNENPSTRQPFTQAQLDKVQRKIDKLAVFPGFHIDRDLKHKLQQEYDKIRKEHYDKYLSGMFGDDFSGDEEERLEMMQETPYTFANGNIYSSFAIEFPLSFSHQKDNMKKIRVDVESITDLKDIVQVAVDFLNQKLDKQYYERHEEFYTKQPWSIDLLLKNRASCLKGATYIKSAKILYAYHGKFGSLTPHSQSWTLTFETYAEIHVD